MARQLMSWHGPRQAYCLLQERGRQRHNTAAECGMHSRRMTRKACTWDSESAGSPPAHPQSRECGQHWCSYACAPGVQQQATLLTGIGLPRHAAGCQQAGQPQPALQAAGPASSTAGQLGRLLLPGSVPAVQIIFQWRQLAIKCFVLKLALVPWPGTHHRQLSGAYQRQVPGLSSTHPLVAVRSTLSGQAASGGHTCRLSSQTDCSSGGLAAACMGSASAEAS